jgi:5-formyltetrahydrofolate cyclo-ligase
MGGATDSPKAQLRRTLIARRRAFDPGDLARLGAAACARLAAYAHFRRARHVVLYAARTEEVDPLPLETEARENGARIYYPAVDGAGLAFRAATSSDLGPGHRGVREPDERAPVLARDARDLIVVVPGLAFDRDGSRLGSGLGYYDRTLGLFPHAIRAGLAIDPFVVDRLPVDPWDEPMHLVVSDRRLLEPRPVAATLPGDSRWTT